MKYEKETRELSQFIDATSTMLLAYCEGGFCKLAA